MALKITLLLCVVVLVVANDNCPYNHHTKWTGDSFFDQFNFFTGADPTHGFVQYVDKNTAKNNGYINSNNGKAYIGVDHSSVAGNAGRRSVRLESKKQFSNGLLILDLAHMPGSICGSWPAYWTFGNNWPNNGEIDIIEGVNKQDINQMTLHTNAGCTVGNQWQTGRTVQSNCDVAATGNAGCGVQTVKGNSYGTSFNRNGGGIYAMERTDVSIRVWFFPRNAIPGDVVNNPNPCKWGQPDADFQIGNNCPKSHFGPHNIIFNVAFCGDWAGAVFGQQCGGDCVNYVRNNPNAFSESYWSVNSLSFHTR